MNFLPLLCTVVLLQVKAESSAQISLQLRHATIAEATEAIAKQSSYNFQFSDAVKSDKQRYSIKVKDAPLRIVMSILLHNTSFYYLPQGNIISILDTNTDTVQLKYRVLSNVQINATETLFNGCVISTHDKGKISGAIVTVNRKGRCIKCVTNAAGGFSLDGVRLADVISIQHPDYFTERVPVTDLDPQYFLLVKKDKYKQ